MCEAVKDIIDESRSEGKAEGKIQTLIELVKDGTLPVVKAAAKANMTVEGFTKEMNKQRAGVN